MGRLADMVLLDGDPLADVEALGRPELMMKEGRIVYESARSVKRPWHGHL